MEEDPTGRPAVRLWGPVILYVAVVSILSHQASLRPPGGAPDWLMHMIEFGGLGALWARALAVPGRGLGAFRALLGVAACAAFGALDEFHQSFVPGRTSELRDVAADAGGATLVIALWALVGSIRSRRAGPIEIRLFGRRECHLCDEAEMVLREAVKGYPVHLEKIDVDGDADLRRCYGEEVPVVTVDGRKLFKLRVDPDRLRRILDSAQRRRTS